MRTSSLTVEQRDEEVGRLNEQLAKLHAATSGRGKWWQAAKRAVKLTCAISSATGARKVALECQFDALKKRCSA